MSRFKLPQDDLSKSKEPKGLQEFAAGAQEHATKLHPWDQYDPEELPRYNVSVRLNAYHLEMLRYLSKAADRSQSKILRDILIPELERRAKGG